MTNFHVEVPPRVEYSLNELGETPRPIMKAMEDWGSRYQKQVLKQKDVLQT